MSTNSPVFYRFSDDGYFENVVNAAPDPLASKREGKPVFIQPCDSTETKPAEKADYWPKWTGKTWKQVKIPKTLDELLAFGKIKHDQQTAFWNKMNQVRTELLKDAQYYKQDLNDGYWEITKLPEPTPEEIKEQKANEVRYKRDSLISKTDYLLTPDYPISKEQLTEVKAYRQALRDVPEQSGFPENVAWPEIPKVTALKN